MCFYNTDRKQNKVFDVQNSEIESFVLRRNNKNSAIHNHTQIKATKNYPKKF